jgi:tellurite resistance protein TerC
VLMVIEFSDLIFAVDSVPAIFAVTRDPYIVFFSNIFAIMGLRSLFFLVSHFFSKFFYLKIGLAALLGFIGIKMLTHSFFKISTNASLVVISAILLISIIASVIHNKREAG